MPHDFAHYFTLFMIFILTPGAILSGLGSIYWNARVYYIESSKHCRRKRLKKQFREEYTAWKKAERCHDGTGYVHAESASIIAYALLDLGV